MKFKVMTFNLLFKMENWERRRDLIVAELKAEQPDLIGLQEVRLPEDTSAWLAQQLEIPHVYLVTFCRKNPPYGIAIFSRYPFVQKAQLDLESQGRFAQYVQVEVDGKPLVFCNGHYYFSPYGATPERVKQIQLLLDWLGELPPHMPVVAVGDFNGAPPTPAIELMRDRFASAYAFCHGREPEYTYPSDGSSIHQRETRDYIFINQHLRAHSAQVIFDEPSPEDPTLYPSDHLGLSAKLEIVPAT